MLTKGSIMLFLAVSFNAVAAPDPLVYVISLSHYFGTTDLNTGIFTQIGPNTPEIQQGLVAGPNGSLLTLGASGNLDSINPRTGVTTVIGPTGLGNCSTPVSACGPTSANDIVGFGGAIYATDYRNDLYRINPSTGAAAMIGATGIPAVPFPPFSMNADGSFNYYDETLFGSGGKLYATFDAGTFNPASGEETSLVGPALYQIDPATGIATFIAPTAKDLAAAVDVNGTVYAFEFPGESSEVLTLNPANGQTTFLENFDSTAGIVDGAAFVPEPASLVLGGIGIAAVLICIRRRHI
jgi:outer membrane protein assembly factor BamB